MTCDRLRLLNILDQHLLPDEVENTALVLGKNYPHPAFLTPGNLKGNTKREQLSYAFTVLGTYGADALCSLCEAALEVRSGDTQLAEEIARVCVAKGRKKSGHGMMTGSEKGGKVKKLPKDATSGARETKDERPRSFAVSVIFLLLASLDFAGLFVLVVATFRWAVGTDLQPIHLIIMPIVAAILALVFFPFILVLLNIFSPEMAQQQFNLLHDFVAKVFPSLLSYFDGFSKLVVRNRNQDATQEQESQKKDDAKEKKSEQK